MSDAWLRARACVRACSVRVVTVVRVLVRARSIDGSECGRDRPRFGLDSINPEIGCL
jgi:hypothetical protein